jgi:hypothetical protein
MMTWHWNPITPSFVSGASAFRLSCSDGPDLAIVEHDNQPIQNLVALLGITSINLNFHIYSHNPQIKSACPNMNKWKGNKNAIMDFIDEFH